MTRLVTRKLVPACLALALTAGTATALSITAATTALLDVQSAVDAAADGDVVVVPPGVSVWSAALKIDSGITLRGAGIGSSVIVNARTGWFEALVEVTASAGRPFRITGFTFGGQGGGNNADHILITGSASAFRIDHNEFTGGGAHSIWIRGDIYGVIDNNLFIDPSREVVSMFDTGTGDESWSQPLALGTDQAVYVEDNLFEFNVYGDHAITSINGGRYVFRYNTITSAASLNASQVDVHGNFFADRGGRTFEIYENDLFSGESYQGMYIRGGTGVIFDNRFSGQFYRPIIFANYRSFGTPSGETAGPCGYSACVWPAPDQIADTHLWNNTYEGTVVVPYITDRGLEREHIQSGRDYFLSARPGYTPYTYPHPLTDDGSAGTPPAPPAGLRVGP